MVAKILIAEDHQASLDLLRYLFQAGGYVTMTAENGEAALELARRERPDLIICDLQMPKMNGYGLVEQLKREAGLEEIPMVAVTAFSMIGDREQVLLAGFDGYFSKPIDPEHFVAEIEQFLPPALRARGNSER
jgi:two-component system, cell cycle response regulator DivK